MNRVTTHDVATATGVNVATVDRVLKSRNEGQASAIEKVNSVMEKPKLIHDAVAVNLARRKKLQFTFVVPAGEMAVLKDARFERGTFRAHAPKDRSNIQSIAAPRLVSQAVAAANGAIANVMGDGVAVVAIESKIVPDAINRLRRRGGRVVSFVVDILSPT